MYSAAVEGEDIQDVAVPTCDKPFTTVNIAVLVYSGACVYIVIRDFLIVNSRCICQQLKQIAKH